MRKGFTEYLTSIGITEAFHGKIESAYEFFRMTCRDEIQDIFVTDYITEDGIRMYESIWFFSEKYCMEAHQFVTKEEFDVAPIKNRVTRWIIQKQSYDFEKATEKSRLHITYEMQPMRIKSFLKASKENCDYLKEIFFKYISPNLQE